MKNKLSEIEKIREKIEEKMWYLFCYAEGLKGSDIDIYAEEIATPQIMRIISQAQSDQIKRIRREIKRDFKKEVKVLFEADKEGFVMGVGYCLKKLALLEEEMK